ncbi:hypothetical protein KVR01_011979 [Diaporthe batatas]|uniref:uncharacterized protein n=1 Tax=Diaporthe batatas TaxID=748121 RepID=UPI001D04D3A6|nr:uncharacterized protein KVR01_011979 [Diaporthe batatas]KAG8158218.1 hypothetical protein KVR01_011979 [Diaporthe batatas]
MAPNMVSSSTQTQSAVSESTVDPENTTAGSTPQEPEETPSAPQSIIDTTTSQDADIVSAIHDGAVLREVQNSLREISYGVDELSTTVQDLLGLSESEGNSSEDCANDSEHRGRPRFSWSKLKSNARRRRRYRQGLEETKDSENGDEVTNTRPEIINDVRECNDEQFQTSSNGDSNTSHCIDILIEVDSPDKDNPQLNETFTTGRTGMIDTGEPDHVPDPDEEPSSEHSETKWIRMIRINSRVVLATLKHLGHATTDPGFGFHPVEFPRPFQVLISMHEKMKNHSASMKSKNFNQGISNLDLDLDKMWKNKVDSRVLALINKDNALDELTCFVDFMESRIMPDSRRYRGPSSTLPKTIRYEDLWYLFKPGDFIYLSPDATARPMWKSSALTQTIFRVIQTRVTNISPTVPFGFNPQGGFPQSWALLTHFIDHDGTSYAPVPFFISTIAPFPGKKKVTELVAYPVSYLEDERIMAEAISDGQNFVSLMERRSGFYSGWTQTVNPLGQPVEHVQTASPGKRLSSPEHIESEILVDFQETFHAIPDWKAPFYRTAPPSQGSDWYRYQLTTIMVNGPSPPIQVDRGNEGEIKPRRYRSARMIRDSTEKNEAITFIIEDELGLFMPSTRPAPTGKFLALLPRRIFAYAVIERRFFPLDIRFVRNSDVHVHDKTFEKLEINQDYKRLILALVKSHFDKVETEKRTNTEIGTQDLIRGKGKGVIILLHGVPGVGKTATAEAVALKWRKPLFPITCGDLGYTAESLEKSLSEIFRLAHHWGCILLLDEADVFITRRERHDLKRNALVSAFLRVLEYYNGIMFLTTNRAGVLDEAVKSRVHLSLHYDHLTKDQTVAIFKQHIQRLRDIERQRNPDPDDQILVLPKEILEFAKEHYDRGGNNEGSGTNLGRWNGRQIRNAFLIASSLAHYDSEEDGENEDLEDLAEPTRKKQKQLGRSQFELVARTTLLYDQYRQSVHSGRSDDRVAFEREEREKPSQPRPPTPARFKN